jgi:protein involved in polysaccharide export with SLBB domain
MDVANHAFVRAKSSMQSIKKFAILAAACLGLAGCASVTNPVADGIPAGRVRSELLARSKEDLRDIPFLLLRRSPIETYRVGPGDTLGIVVDSILGDSSQYIPVRSGETPDAPPSLGYPVVIRDDGTISMPQVAPINVNGMTISEIETALRKAYTIDKKIVQPEKFSAIVTLSRRRTIKVLVIRQDGGGGTSVSSSTIFGQTTVANSPKRGTGQQLELPIGDNDVLTALARTGGLPGVDAINEVVIERSRPETADESKDADGKKLEGPPKPKADPMDPTGAKAGASDKQPVKFVKQFIRIPLRLRPGEPFNFTEQDIILQNGDVVFIAARDADVFYTAGLLGGGVFPLPRDTDLDVIQAIASVRGPLLNGAFSGNNLQGSVVTSGIGTPNPSRCTILRKTAGGGEIRIKVDLNLAFRDYRVRPLIQSQDILVLQLSPAEAFVNYLTQVIKIDTVIRALKTPTVTSDVNTVIP